MSLIKKTSILSAAAIAVLIVVCISSVEYIKCNLEIRAASRKKLEAALLSQEVHETSMQLTKNARAFVDTGNQKYEEAYYELDKIRQGELPRPHDSLTEPDKKIPLEYLIRRSGFEKKEYELLFLSIETSKKLMFIEIKAINAKKGVFLDESGLYSVKMAPNQDLARSLVFGSAYEAALDVIADNCHAFVRVVSARLDKERIPLEEALNRIVIVFYVSLGVMALIVLYWAYFILISILRPVRSCADFATSMTDSFESTRTQEKRVQKENEIDSLLNAVYGMARYLKDRIDFAELKAKETLATRSAAEMVDVELWKAQTISEAKNIFFASMSHEIRTPINAIMGLSDLLLRGDLTEVQRNHIRDIRNSSDSLQKIINDILDSAKMEMGKLELVPADYNFMELLDHVSSLAKVLTKEKNLAFIFEKENDLPVYLFGDADRVRQIILNLLSNAVKYTNQGTVCLKVSSKDKKLIFEVIDTGIGIQEEVLPRLFNVFSQVDRKKNKGIVGTGLGLYISKILTELMGGTITVKTAPGEGSSFKVIIPLQLGNKDALYAKEEPLTECTWDAHILVVDDNEINLNVASALLEYLGIDCEEAHSGASAIQLVKQKSYDLIFMDHMMPEMDGVEATAAIRALGNWCSTVPIIALTANVTSEAKDLFMANSMNDFLAKPIDIAMLQAMLDKWLSPEKKTLKTPGSTDSIL